MAIAVAGCSSSVEMNDGEGTTEMTNGDDEQPVSLRGTQWKLEGIVDTETGDTKVLDPKDCEECYTLTFDTDSTFMGNTVNNEFLGTYESSTGNIQILGSTKVLEQYDGKLYFYTMITVPFFSLQENKLKLYYNEKNNYLLFRQIQP